MKKKACDSHCWDYSGTSNNTCLKSTGILKEISVTTHLCWPLRWESRPLWWLQPWWGPCPPPAWCVGAAQNSELPHGQRWGSWGAPFATPSASAAGCSLAASRRTNAHTANVCTDTRKICFMNIWNRSKQNKLTFEEQKTNKGLVLLRKKIITMIKRFQNSCRLTFAQFTNSLIDSISGLDFKNLHWKNTWKCFKKCVKLMYDFKKMKILGKAIWTKAFKFSATTFSNFQRKGGQMMDK